MDISTEETSTDAKCKKKKNQHNNTIFPEKRGHKGKKWREKERQDFETARIAQLIKVGVSSNRIILHSWLGFETEKQKFEERKGKTRERERGRERKREQEVETKPALYSLVLYIFTKGKCCTLSNDTKTSGKNKTRD